MAEATLSTKPQIVVPKEAREALRTKAGDGLMVVTRGATVVLLPKPASHTEALRGLARGVFEGDHARKERAGWER